METSELFELEIQLPQARLDEQARRLIGFTDRYNRLRQDLQLLIDPEGLQAWSQRFYGRQIPLVSVAAERYPLVIFHGDTGNGKSAMAETMSNSLTRELNREAALFKLSTRVRGSGAVGQMSTLINQAFQVVAKEAGRSRLSFLIIDEADSLAASRDAAQSHHEDKVAVNTLIQKIDEVRRYGGRVLVFLCTNRFTALDPAIVRRSARIEQFDRPTDKEREAVLRLDCEGLGLGNADLADLVRLTGPDGHSQIYGFTYSDLRTRLLPEALARAYPDRKIDKKDLLTAAQELQPSPSLISNGA